MLARNRPTASVIRIFLSGARRRRILGSDIIAGDAFGVRVSGLAERRYGMYYLEVSTNPLRSLQQAQDKIWLPGGS